MWKIELLPLAVLVCPLQKSVSASGFGYKRLIFSQRILRFPLADLGRRLQTLCFPLADLGSRLQTLCFPLADLVSRQLDFPFPTTVFALADLDCRPLVFG